MENDFQICFRICNQEDPRKRGGIGIERKISAPDLSRREVGPEENTENKYTFVSRHQNMRRNNNLLNVNKCFGNVAKFKYLG
jgi:hypothetical protein